MDDDVPEFERTVWVGNLSYKVNDELLYELFVQAGPVYTVVHPKDYETGRPRTYAFIVYKHLESVDYAINLFAKTELYGRELILNVKGGAAFNRPANPRSVHQRITAPENREDLPYQMPSMKSHAQSGFGLRHAPGLGNFAHAGSRGSLPNMAPAGAQYQEQGSYGPNYQRNRQGNEDRRVVQYEYQNQRQYNYDRNGGSGFYERPQYSNNYNRR